MGIYYTTPSTFGHVRNFPPEKIKQTGHFLLKQSLLQQHNSKASILQCSAFFMVQLSHPYVTIGKTIALTMWTFVSKVMSLLFHMLSKFVTVFLLRSKHLLISWLLSLSAVILESKKIQSVTASTLNYQTGKQK